MIDSVGAEENGKGSQAVYNFGLHNYRPYFACTYVGLLQLIPSRQNSTVEFETATRLGSMEPMTGGWMNEEGR